MIDAKKQDENYKKRLEVKKDLALKCLINEIENKPFESGSCFEFDEVLESNSKCFFGLFTIKKPCAELKNFITKLEKLGYGVKYTKGYYSENHYGCDFWNKPTLTIYY